MENLSIVKVIDLFLMNSEILLRSTTRNRYGATCTLGGYEKSICKSFYSTRCGNTTSAINFFFQGDYVAYFAKDYSPIFGSNNKLGNIMKMDTQNKIYDETLYRTQYLEFLEKFCDYVINIRKEDSLYTFSFSGLSSKISTGDENLVGHIYSILRVLDTSTNTYKNYIIQGYIFKYSPICVEIDNDTLRDYLRVFYAVRNYSSISVDSFENYDEYLVNPKYTMYLYNTSNNLFSINPWFNEKFNELFKAYYHDPYKNDPNVPQLGISADDTRYYTYNSMSLTSLLPPPIIYYNMLSYLYVYYNVLSYDIYIFRLIERVLDNKALYKNPIQYTYMLDNFDRYNIPDNIYSSTPYEYSNPIVYDDDVMVTSIKHIISFWENNFFLRFSNILSDDYVDIIDNKNPQGVTNYLFDLYSTLLYSAKTSILNAKSYIENVNCNGQFLIDKNIVTEIYNEGVICKQLINSRYDRTMYKLSSLLGNVYLPHYLLMNSFDMYDYFNNKSCIIYEVLTKSLIYIQDMLDTTIFPPDASQEGGNFSIIFSNFSNELTNNRDQDFRNNLQYRISNLYDNVYRIYNDPNISWYSENGKTRRPDGTIINGYNPIKLTAFSNLLVIAIGFYFIEKVNEKLLRTWDALSGTVRSPVSEDFIFSYEDCVNMFYSTNDRRLNRYILDLFLELRRIVNIIFSLYYEDTIFRNLDPVVKSYGIYIKMLKYYLLTDQNMEETEILDEIENYFPNVLL